MTFTPPENTRDISALLQIMANLRDPNGGCPWDVEQDYRSISPYTIEEAYEVADAIDRNDMRDLQDELGDLLLQVVFHAQMAAEEGDFTFDDVVQSICDKMIRRHPHVYEKADGRDSDEQTVAWEEIKAAERASKGKDKARLLDDVPVGLPAMTRAIKLQKRAARVGFDWPHASDVIAKINEEAEELAEMIPTGNQDRIEDEFGDLMFTLANLSRHLKVDPENALRRTNEKFRKRFMEIENHVDASNREFSDYSLEELEAIWQAAKSVA